MQTLCKPPRRVYDAKAIEACHNEEDGLDLHDVEHAITAGSIAATATAFTANPLVGFGVGVLAYVTEAEEQITHALAEAGDAIANAAANLWDSATSSGGGGTTGGPSPPMNDDGTFGSLAPCAAGWCDD